MTIRKLTSHPSRIAINSWFHILTFSVLFSNSARHSSDLASFKSLEDTSKALSAQIVVCEESRSRCEADLRIEREWRSALQAKELEYKDLISKLQLKISQHGEDAKKHDKMRTDYDKLKKKYNEDQHTLEELGIQLSMSKLQVSELKEKSKIAEEMASGKLANDWTPDESASKCNCCESQFSLTKRKHHCRACCEVVCKNCSEHLMPLEDNNGENCSLIAFIISSILLMLFRLFFRYSRQARESLRQVLGYSN